MLIVGAGAVGQVFGHYMALGGASVGVSVRPHRVDEARRFTLYRVTGRDRTDTGVFRPITVVSTPAEVAGHSWDQIWLCVPSDALDRSWLESLIAASGSTTIVGLTPGLHDAARLREWFPSHRHVDGVIGFMAWHSPLPGEARGPGTSVWLPPLSASFFDGPDAGSIVNVLRSGGLPAQVKRGAAGLGAQASALMLPVIGALGEAGWSLRDLIHGRRLAPAMASARHALRVVDRVHGTNSAFLRFIARAWLARLALGLAPRIVPFPFEAYLRVHFTKVGSQVTAMLRDYGAPLS
ncbi:MAG TPA: 2-dehydropantoate 2-reductase N-terminal domain-containing protein [Candidatus Eisenbacteria bacterium]